MKNKIKVMTAVLFSTLALSACGADPAMTQFKNEMDAFCTTISEIDTSINAIDATQDNAATTLLGYLNDLDTEFRELAELDFPDEFDYLESLSDEASAYMTEAVSSYHSLYTGDTYDEALAEYAKENYSRAYKRIQIILSILHGEDPDNANYTITTETSEETSSEAYDGPIILEE